MASRGEDVLRVTRLGLLMMSVLPAWAAGLSGHVTDENAAPVAGARITVRPAAPGSLDNWQTQSDAAGAFSLAVAGAGDFLVDVERQGYYPLRGSPFHA